jgi:epoxyqueuosine reductase
MALTSDLKTFCKGLGADLIGIADLESFRKELPISPPNLIDPFFFGISMGIALKDDIIEVIEDRPTPEYARHYREVNARLDQISHSTVQWILKRGLQGKAIPASEIVDETNLLGNISHKAVARMAGLGWQGKSLLLVTPEYGPRVRLVTILTDMPLTPDEPIKNRCGKCFECAKACPVSAIRNISTESHYQNREAAVDLEKCHQKLIDFRTFSNIGNRICGICIRACPYGKKKSR